MWPKSQLLADSVAFTEEILNGKLYSLCSAKRKFAPLILDDVSLHAKINQYLHFKLLGIFIHFKSE